MRYGVHNSLLADDDEIEDDKLLIACRPPFCIFVHMTMVLLAFFRSTTFPSWASRRVHWAHDWETAVAAIVMLQIMPLRLVSDPLCGHNFPATH